MNHQPIWIESFDYFRAKNPFSGSGGRLGFKIFPEKDQDRLRVVLWEGMNCCEKSTPREERCYPFSEEGLAEACSWVRAEIEESRRQMDEEDYD